MMLHDLLISSALLSDPAAADLLEGHFLTATMCENDDCRLCI
jgi:hypothetical protein